MKEIEADKVIEQLRQELEAANAQNARFKHKEVLVGVGWYGDGGHTVTLNKPMFGKSRIIFSRENNRAVVDYTTWVSLRDSDHAVDGLLVRDDSIIEDMEITGVVAEKDKKKGVNSYTDSEIEKLLQGKITELKKVINVMTSHWGPQHFLKVAKKINFGSETKLLVVRTQRDRLFVIHKWNRLHNHDIAIACEQNDIIFEGADRDEVINKLAELELQADKVVYE